MYIKIARQTPPPSVYAKSFQSDEIKTEAINVLSANDTAMMHAGKRVAIDNTNTVVMMMVMTSESSAQNLLQEK